MFCKSWLLTANLTEGEGQIYATLLIKLGDLVAPQNLILRTSMIKKSSVAEFKEFERRFKFKPRFKYGWFHLKLY